MRFDRLVLNEPHASVEGLFDNQLSFWSIDESFINEAVVDMTDWHTDFLFHGLQDRRIKTIRFPYSRFIVDAERLWDDPLESVGQGLLYRQFGKYTRDIPVWAEEQLQGLWHNHQRKLRNALAGTNSALLLDCHSFPARMSDVDVCIGFNEDWSKPDSNTLEFAVNWFEENGFKVGINTPYSNSIAPECSFRYQSMMLEVNKKAYLKGETILLKTRAGKYNRSLSSTIAGLMSRLLMG